MNRRVLVTDFSGVYEAQGFLPALQATGAEPLLLDFRNVEGASCYCDADAAWLIGQSLPAELPRLRWLDSGDYHYMSHLLAAREQAPFHLVLLDHHPDDQPPAFGGMLSCGSWVKALQEQNPQLRSVLAIGPEGCPEDIPEGWLEARRGERLYLSLDKDILGRDWARTDWTQGTHSLPQVKGILGRLLKEGEVVAVDICGELQESKGATAEDLRINRDTNIELYKFITTYLK